MLRPIVPPPGTKPASPQGKEKGDKGGKGGKEGGSRSGASGGKEGGDPPVQGGSPVAAGAAAAAEEASPPVPLPAKVGIPLEGCTVELVADGLKGRSEFIRRAPLLVSHPKWPLLEGEQAFYLWAGTAGGGGGDVRLERGIVCLFLCALLVWHTRCAESPAAVQPCGGRQANCISPLYPIITLQMTPRPSSSGCMRWGGGARTARSWRPSTPCELAWAPPGFLAGFTASLVAAGRAWLGGGEPVASCTCTAICLLLLAFIPNPST